ncbi:MAG: Uncharacterised protein [Rhodospirillaceae bacterium]|nr:MAG: Uncharacterised protein [Rhodospirillaceae bacterium]
MFFGQRLEVQPISRIVVGRYGLRVTVDHDGLVAGFLERVAGMDAAVVEFDALPDPVRTPTEDHDLLLVRGLGLAHRCIEAIIDHGRVEVVGVRGELSRAGVDALVDPGTGRRAVGDQVLNLAQEPRVNPGRAVHVFYAHPRPQRGAYGQNPRRCRRAQVGSDRHSVNNSAVLDARHGDIVSPRQPGFQTDQRLVEALLEITAQRHDLADRLHRRGQVGLRPGELFEGKARDLGDDVVDAGLERRRGHSGHVVLQLVQRVTDGELGSDLGNREAGCLGRQRRRA